MLSVKSILALYHTQMVPVSPFFRRIPECQSDFKIRHRRELHGCVLPAGSLHTDGTGGNDHIASQNLRVHAAAGADTDKGIRAAMGQFLHRDGRGRSADAGGTDGDLFSLQRAGVYFIFPVKTHKVIIVKMLCDLLTPPRITG